MRFSLEVGFGEAVPQFFANFSENIIPAGLPATDTKHTSRRGYGGLQANRRCREMTVTTLWPTAVEFVEAVQDNEFTFADHDLRYGRPIVSKKTHEPLYTSGGFATVCFIQNRNERYAVKFFVNPDSDRSNRYAAISRTLCALRLPYTVSFDLVEQGVNIRGNHYPVLKMEFVKGILLHHFLEQNINHPEKIRNTANSWVAMSDSLRQAGIAHGDLQHRNVFVDNNNLKLIDYDGMYVPALSGAGSAELGLPSFQHPGRNHNHFGPSLDNFSDWAMYTTLIALSSDRSLWSLVNVADQRLLFSREDYTNPGNSEIFYRLRGSTDSEVSGLARQLESFLTYDLENIPTLSSQIAIQPVRHSCSPILVDIFGNLISSANQNSSPISHSSANYFEPAPNEEFVPAAVGSNPASPANNSYKNEHLDVLLFELGLMPFRVIYQEVEDGGTIVERMTGTPASSQAISKLRVLASLHAVACLFLLFNGWLLQWIILLAILAAIYACVFTSKAMSRYMSRTFITNVGMSVNDAAVYLENKLRIPTVANGYWNLVRTEQNSSNLHVVCYHPTGSDKGIVCDIVLEPTSFGTQIKMRFQGSGIVPGIGFTYWNASNGLPTEQLSCIRVMKRTLQEIQC